MAAEKRMPSMFIELAAATAIIGGIALALGSFEPRYVRLEQRSGKCLWCRYSREGLAFDAACPECGASWQDSTIVVKRRTRPSLRAAVNIVAGVGAIVLVMVSLPIVLASLWYCLARASGYNHERAWRLSMHPADYQEYGSSADAAAFILVALSILLCSAVVTQLRFGSRAFRRLGACELLLAVTIAICAVLAGWIGDLRTWTSIAEVSLIRNWSLILFFPGLSFALVIPFWRTFRQREIRILAHLRTELEGPDHLRAP